MTLTTQDLHSIKHLFDDRFDGIDRRLDAMDTRLDKMDGRLDKMDTRLDKMDGRLNGHDSQFAAIRGDIDDLAIASAQQFDQIDRHFEDVHGKLDDLKEDLAVVKDVVKDHSFRISRLEHRTNTTP